jgi:mRNA interferase RelE/StbE
VATPYHVKVAPAAVRQIKELPVKQRKQIIRVAEALAINPRPPGSKKVEGMSGLYCEVINNLRLIYKIEDQEVLLLVVK